EAVRELVELTGVHELRMQEIGPWNFLGIEVKPWAREIAELTLWIGFHQTSTYGSKRVESRRSPASPRRRKPLQRQQANMLHLPPRRIHAATACGSEAAAWPGMSRTTST